MAKDPITESRRTGGPAFASPGYSDGMTLRDWFAGQALSSLKGIPSMPKLTEIVGLAYDIADAMLERRRQDKEDAKS